jgi:hypothetical protein
MEIKKTLTKYIILLLVYIVIERFIEPYGLRLYYSTVEDPIGNPQAVGTIQSIVTLLGFLVNLIFVVFIIIDTKAKKMLDWLIILVTFLSPETGITIFIGWKIYKEITEKYGA